MTLSKTKRDTTLLPGDGVRTTFDFDFLVLDENTDLLVDRIDANRDNTGLTIGIDFSVVNNGDETGGTVTYPITGSPLPMGEFLHVRREVVYTQLVPISNQSKLNLGTVETMIDRLTMHTQQLAELLERSLKFDTDSQQKDIVVPEPDANAVLAWDSLAQKLVNVSGLSSSNPVSSFVNTLLGQANAGDFLTALGVTAFIKTLLDDTDAATARATLNAAALDSLNVYTKTNRWAVAAPVASATVVTLPTDGNIVHLTGGGTVNDFTHVTGAGPYLIICDATTTFTHNAAILKCPGNETLIVNAGGAVLLHQDTGSVWQITAYFPHSAPQKITGLQHRQLVQKTNATNPDYQVDIDADRLVLYETTTGYAITRSSINLTVDLTATGVNGLDTGSEAASTWYYLHVIYNPTTFTVAGLFSTSYDNPTMPPGYTYRVCVGARYNNGSSNLLRGVQRGREFTYFENQYVVNNGSAPTYTSVSCSAVVPQEHGAIQLVLQKHGHSSGRTQMDVAVNAASGYLSRVWSIDVNRSPWGTARIVPETTQVFFYRNNAGNASVWVVGYMFEG